MLLSTIRTLSRLYVPKGKLSVISNTVLDLLANNAIVDVAAKAVCLKTNSAFTITADQSEYSLSVVITDFLVPDKPGLWWNSGTTAAPAWKKLTPYTLAKLDEDFPTWRDHDSSDPQRYSIDGDVLTLDPPPDTTLANGLKLYHGALPPTLATATNHTFSNTTVLFPRLEIFNEAILKYIYWKLSPIVGETPVETKLKEEEYYRELSSKIGLFKKRPDITPYSKMGGQTIPEEF